MIALYLYDTRATREDFSWLEVTSLGAPATLAAEVVLGEGYLENKVA